MTIIRRGSASHPIKPTSPRRPSAWQPNPGRGSTYRRGKSVQTTGTTSGLDPQDWALLVRVLDLVKACAPEGASPSELFTTIEEALRAHYAKAVAGERHRSVREHIVSTITRSLTTQNVGGVLIQITRVTRSLGLR
jgi:hypothetical protein